MNQEQRVAELREALELGGRRALVKTNSGGTVVVESAPDGGPPVKAWVYPDGSVKRQWGDGSITETSEP